MENTDTLEQLASLINKIKPEPADAIVLLAGDLLHRIPKTVELYELGLAPFIVITSSANDRAYGSMTARELREELIKRNVPSEVIVWEESASNTRAEAESTLRIAQKNGWQRLLLVTTEYHQCRVLLTWLKAISDMENAVHITIVPVIPFPTFRNETRDEAITRELARICLYQKKGDVAEWETGISYLKMS
jgi:uncharacterized SAM-binding protein YcdF (DUF218 family)